MQIDYINVPIKYRDKINYTVSSFLKNKSMNKDVYIGVHFASRDEMRTLNNRFRHKNAPTDVLSFPVWDKLSKIPKEGGVNLGDIYVCPDETNIEENLSFLIEHSLKHLIGIHHKL